MVPVLGPQNLVLGLDGDRKKKSLIAITATNVQYGRQSVAVWGPTVGLDDGDNQQTNAAGHTGGEDAFSICTISSLTFLGMGEAGLVFHSRLSWTLGKWYHEEV